jgi:NAD(P)-dependent dehydrogenase (short-subunit alcohol dehydrogenase family)
VEERASGATIWPLSGVFFGIKHAVPIMKAQRSGSIVSTSSVCGLMSGVGSHLYNVAKAGVVMMTRSLALELAEWNVRVNCVCPGFVATALAAGGSLTELGADTSARRLEKARERMGHSQPITRMGEPDDVAALMTFLAAAVTEHRPSSKS